ncbi:MAG: hypothetical protein AABW59_00890 [archaeon]
MSLSLFVPNLKSNSSKDLVVQVLVNEWPLSAREIFNRVKKNSSSSVSYQAVHKALKLLENDKILYKESGKYSINSSWVESVSDFASFLKRNLDSQKAVYPLQRSMVFSTVYEVDQFLSEFGKMLKPKKEDEFALHWHHFWIPLFFSKDAYCAMKELLVGSTFYCVTPSNTSIDKWVANFWNSSGVNEKTGVKGAYGIDMIIFKDIIVQVFYPKEIKDMIDKVYNSTKDPSKLDIDKFFKTVFEKKTRIPVLITKNEEVASELLAQTKALFK